MNSFFWFVLYKILMLQKDWTCEALPYLEAVQTTLSHAASCVSNVLVSTDFEKVCAIYTIVWTAVKFSAIVAFTLRSTLFKKEWPPFPDISPVCPEQELWKANGMPAASKWHGVHVACAWKAWLDSQETPAALLRRGVDAGASAPTTRGAAEHETAGCGEAGGGFKDTRRAAGERGSAAPHTDLPQRLGPPFCRLRSPERQHTQRQDRSVAEAVRPTFKVALEL